MMVKHKKLTSKCGITIPKDIRANYGLFGGEAVDLVETEGGILLRKHTASCFVCGSMEDVVSLRRLELCGKCRAELRSRDEGRNA